MSWRLRASTTKMESDDPSCEVWYICKEMRIPPGGLRKATVTLEADDENSKRASWTNFRFSIRSVFLLTTAVCIGFAIFPFVVAHPRVLGPVLLNSYVLFAGVAFGLSGRADLGRYFGRFFLAMLLSSYLAAVCLSLPSTYYVPSNFDIVFNATLIMVGLWLSCTALLHGHWSTKLVTLFPLFLILASAISVARFAIFHSELF